MSSSAADRLRVLVIDDDASHAEVVAEGLDRVGYSCDIATSGAQGAKKIESEDYDVILTDLRMAGIDGLGIVRRAKEKQPEAKVVVITGFGEVHSAVEAIKLGAAHYLLKPVNLAELRTIVDKSAEELLRARELRDLRRQLDEKFGFEGVVGNSPKMQEVLNRLKAYAPTKATVLILGENGTGKELVAKALHTNSPRKNKPFVALNCTALHENLLDDELFGHEAGAFTGAERMRKGRFEHANGGTLFLDEIGDMALPLQAKLLRVLENGEVFRIGSNEPIKVDVRLISATNRDLETMVNEGKFRQDLYYRLKVGTIRLPPLRERLNDIPLLVEHFRKEFNQKHSKNVTRVHKDLERALREYDWPGNVRQLRNLIESAIVQDTDGELTLDDMDENEPLRQQAGSATGVRGADHLIGRTLAEIERFYMEKTLDLTKSRDAAAKILDIGERTLYRKIQDWKEQDEIRAAIAKANGNLAEAAKQLNMTLETLGAKMKRLGLKRPPQEG